MIQLFRASLVLAFAVFASANSALADWVATEKVVPYKINGATPMELYRSIGDRGPQIGAGRVIAHTNFKLTWQRDYQPQGTACVLVSAKPKLTITYTLPKPSQTLQGDTKARWDRFYAGIVEHEKLHGEFIRDLVRQIEQLSVGLRAENDPQCQKVRQALQAQLKPISDAHVARHGDYDRVEMSPGGAVHQLILTFLNP